MNRDIEYLLVNTRGVEEVVFSAKTIKKIAEFIGYNYSSTRRAFSQQTEINFENKKLKILSVDLKADYERENHE